MKIVFFYFNIDISLICLCTGLKVDIHILYAMREGTMS